MYGQPSRRPEPPKEPSLLSSILAVGIAFVVIGFIAYACSAHAHDAPGGWHYPSQCCSPDDTSQLCHPVECDEISEGDDGSYRWQGLTFTRQQVFPTQDHQCHACNSWAIQHSNRKPEIPYCLFIRSSS